MGAPVGQRPHTPVGAPKHDGVARELGGVEVAGVGNLAVVADIEPGVTPELLDLQVEQLAIEIHVAMDLIRTNQRPDRLRIVPITTMATPKSDQAEHDFNA